MQNLRLIRPPVTRKYSLTARRGAGNVSERRRGASGGALTAVTERAHSPGNLHFSAWDLVLKLRRKQTVEGAQRVPTREDKRKAPPGIHDSLIVLPAARVAPRLHHYGVLVGVRLPWRTRKYHEGDFRFGLPGPHCTSISFQGLWHCFD